VASAVFERGRDGARPSSLQRTGRQECPPDKMRILVAPDKFKNSLGAREVADAIAAGLRDVLPAAQIEIQPVADGGEGTASIIRAALGGEWISAAVRDPLDEMVSARYAWIPRSDGPLAVLEVAEASGLWRIPETKRDVMRASSFGSGELLLDAVGRGARSLIFGLGGSATNDGGFGLARALGFRFLDHAGALIADGVEDLLRLDRIRASVCALPPIIAAADVTNPLLGERGATQMFARQKGASPSELKMLERALARLAQVVARDLGIDCRETPGAGAAGGIGFGLMSFCGAKLRSGFEVVAELTGLEARITSSEVVVTGEGNLDVQTWNGKAPAGVAALARQHGKRVFAIVGQASGAGEAHARFDGVHSLVRAGISVEESMRRAVELLRERARELAAEL
jgi:glycerate kinase